MTTHDAGRRMKVMGIDPGSQVTGWGLVHGSGNRFQSAGAGEIRAPGSEELIDRLARYGRPSSSMVLSDLLPWKPVRRSSRPDGVSP